MIEISIRMRALEEPGFIVDIEWRGGGTYLDIQRNGKTYCRKVFLDNYPNVLFGKRNCHATDEQTGIKVTSKGWKSTNGAYKHAVADLVRTLVDHGYLNN